jgi:cytochrome P450
MVRINPNEVAVADLAASRIIHNVKDSFPKGDWYVKIAPFLSDEVARTGMFAMLDPKPHGEHRRLLSQGFSKSMILKWESRSKQGSRKPLPRSNETRWLAPPMS